MVHFSFEVGEIASGLRIRTRNTAVYRWLLGSAWLNLFFTLHITQVVALASMCNFARFYGTRIHLLHMPCVCVCA